ncbi:hypothetical protein [Paenibacillus sp. O199]|uniref:hypothetical protein n=1 Tax=Paenibacillus sp. O199 TaxID=1643925 RepID=UPI0007BF31B9|nr:hypothetical protein [Paenibacillus sp. O199]
MRSAEPNRNRAYARIAQYYPKRSDGLDSPLRSKAGRDHAERKSLTAAELMRGLRSIKLSAATVSTVLCEAKQGETTRSYTPHKERAGL